ncbi:CRISPR-associated helicase/endonuclease Cas3 [Endomicrobium proavitum]|uniref:CRISPR-associated helicase/endonuclease Cas3 n=1 Tax=Endomicrobium proavitum TaxID=1408281 RepID=UPI000697C761|nr:helicase-related protein [Endomicrobium proavitum]
MQQLANSIIIFDEIQTLPIKCVHIFNNAINFLIDICGATVILCTATQPLLNTVDSNKGAIKLCEKADIVNNIEDIFETLKRVEIKPNLDKPYTSGNIAKKAVKLANENNNCLVVCNTTESAREIFEIIRQDVNILTYHLSAKMCPIHRKEILREIFLKLDAQRNNKVNEKIIVVSTQVIEAGVDIDFNSGIRALTGLDSIAQTAGRINRNGLNDIKQLYVYEFEETLGNMEEITVGKKISKRIFDEVKIEHITPEIMNEYYKHCFVNRAEIMDYKIKPLGSLLEYLSNNETAISEYTRTNNNSSPRLCMKQSFKEASEKFKSIDAPTNSVIVPYGYGQRIINELCNEKYDFKKIKSLLKEAQQYSVNLYDSDIRKLGKAIKVISKNLDVLYLEPCYYDDNFGITIEPTINKGGISI